MLIAPQFHHHQQKQNIFRITPLEFAHPYRWVKPCNDYKLNCICFHFQFQLYTSRSIYPPIIRNTSLFQITHHHMQHTLQHQPTLPTPNNTQPEQQNYNKNQLLWQRLTNYTQHIHSPIQEDTITQIEDILSQMLELPQTNKFDFIKERLNVLEQLLPIQNHKVRAKTLQMLSLLFQKIPIYSIICFLQGSCLWMLIDSGNICKEQYQGYCKLVITLFQNRHNITTESNMLKLIDLIPTFHNNVPHQLLIKVCIRLVLANENQNEDTNGLCYRIYSHLRQYKTSALAFIQQLQLRQRIDTTQLLKNSQQIIQTILSSVYNHNCNDSHLQLLLKLIKKAELSSHTLQSIMANIIERFHLSDINYKITILRVLYALLESQFVVSWYFSRELTQQIVSLVVEYSIGGMQSQQPLLVGLCIRKLFGFLKHEDRQLWQYKLKALFYSTISQPQHRYTLAQIQKYGGFQISHAARNYLELITQGYSDPSQTSESANPQPDSDQEMQPPVIEEQSESSQQSYECSDSFFRYRE